MEQQRTFDVQVVFDADFIETVLADNPEEAMETVLDELQEVTGISDPIFDLVTASVTERDSEGAVVREWTMGPEGKLVEAEVKS